MDIKNKFLSRDGQYYDTLTEDSRASIAWDEKWICKRTTKSIKLSIIARENSKELWIRNE